MLNKKVIVSLVSTLLTAASTAQAAELSEPVNFNIQAQALDTALLQFSQQAGIQVFLPARSATGKTTPGVQGSHVAEQALKELLKDSGLTYKEINSHTVAVGPAGEHAAAEATSLHLAQAADQSPSSDPQSNNNSEKKPDAVVPPAAGVPEILIKGSKVLNMDIARSRDDPQPYVIFTREKIAESNPANLQEFLKDRLPMNAIHQSNSQDWGSGNTSSINLRGLGVGNTLILIDGHRTASRPSAGDIRQFDLNNIPIEAVERIEVLPATASGIYGGSATGGVVNVILRRDYRGSDIKLSYDNSFEGESAVKRIDLASGFNLEDGKTNILITASASKQHALYEGERDFATDGRALRLANNPASLESRGGPPLGSTANISSADGSDLVLKSGTPLNLPITYAPVGYAGAASDGGVGLVANAGHYNLNLPNSAVSWDVNGGRAALVNAPETLSADITLRRKFTERIQAFVTADVSRNDGRFPFSFVSPLFTVPASAATNPFNQDIKVTIPGTGSDAVYSERSTDARAVGGLIAQLGAGWKLETDFTWDRSSQKSAYPPQLSPDAAAAIAAGQLDVLKDAPLNLSGYGAPVEYDVDPNVATLRDTVARVSGPIGSLPGGAPTLSALLEHRVEALNTQREYTDFTNGIRTFPGRAQTVDSAYLEFRLPIVSANNALPGVRELEVQIAGRSDRYRTDSVSGITYDGDPPATKTSSRFSSTNPTLALRYQPLESLALRASWGTGFLAPTVGQFSRDAFIGRFSFLTDPRRGNEPAGPFDYYFGGNPDLQPEKSRTWSAGLILTPQVLPGVRLSADWTHISKTNNIVVVPSDLVLMEGLGLIVRGPVSPGDPYGVGKITEVHFDYINLAKATVDALDVQFDYHLDAAAVGSFDFFLVGTWQPHYLTQTLPTDPVQEMAGTYNGPLKLKGNAGLTWHHGALSLGWTARYFGPYYINVDKSFDINQGSASISSQAYHDVFASYRVGSLSGHSKLAARAFGGTEITVGVKNVFNKKPPLDVSANSANSYSYYGDPRLAVYYMTVKKSFGN